MNIRLFLLAMVIGTLDPGRPASIALTVAATDRNDTYSFHVWSGANELKTTKLRTLIGNFGCNLRLKNWETIADNLSKAGWSFGCMSALGREGRTMWIADAHRGDGKRFVVHANEKLTAFVELERAIYDFALDLIS